MLNRFFRTSIRPIFLWTLSTEIICLILFFVFDRYSEWQAMTSSITPLSERIKIENGNLTTIAQICGGLVILVGLFFTGWNTRIAQRNMEIAEAGKITDRFSKAVEQLGNDKLEIRLGGIYALERITLDSARDHPQVRAVLAAFVRTNSPWKENKTPKAELAADIQAILTVIGRLKCVYHNNDYLSFSLEEMEKWRLDLSRTNLSKAYLIKAHFEGADLQMTRLDNANLCLSDLRLSNLEGANLSNADLGGANVEMAYLKKANLEGANLEITNFHYTNLQLANLKKAKLGGAILKGAHLQQAQLDGAELAYANLEGANICDVNLEGARLTKALNLTIDQLSTVKTLYNVVGLDSTILGRVLN